MATDVKIYKQQHSALVVAESEKAIKWVLENVKHYEGAITYHVPSDCVGELAEDLVRNDLIVEIKG